jgi:hypothetical protein
LEVAQEASELLRERRSGLISAAVTGKIDVRAAVPGFASNKAETPVKEVA